MSLNPVHFRLSVSAVFLAVIILSIGASLSAEPILEVRVDSVYVCALENQVTVPVYLKSVEDTVSGFVLWIILSRPDLINFTGDTWGMIDTAGTLISGWNYVIANAVGGEGSNCRVVGMAPGVGIPHPGLPPQNGEIPLFRLKAAIYDIADTVTDTTVNLIINDQSLSFYSFSDPHGQTIGLIYDTILDTSLFRCLQWDNPPNDTICLNWERIPTPPYDSIDVDTVTVPVLDTSQMHNTHGLVGVLHPGDANHSLTINIQDITHLINFLYNNGPSPIPYLAGDPNNDLAVNIRDITYLIGFLYKSGAAPFCM